jgi:hypothetical protein
MNARPSEFQMARHLLAMWLAVAVAAGVAESAPAVEPAADDAVARQLLADVVAQLPREALTLSGQINVTRRGGMEVKRLLFAMHLDMRSNPSLARYTIRDAIGSDIEELTVLREPGKPPRYEYRAGNPLRSAPLPNLGAAIQQTDISWTDLTLQFLWWERVKRIGRDVVKGRGCHVVDVAAPVRGAAGSELETGQVPWRVRIWIDEQVPMMLRAEAYDAGDRLVRALWVKSFKRIRNRWMIKEMEVQSEPMKHRTHFIVDNLIEGGSPAPVVEDTVQPTPEGKADGG